MELPYREIAKRLNVAPSTALQIFKRFEETGEVSATKQPVRPTQRRLSPQEELIIIAMIMESPTLLLHEICGNILQVCGVSVSEATICRILRRHGFTRKKIRAVAIQRNLQVRAAFMAEALLYNRQLFVWIDETGCDGRTYMRKFGYSLRGERAECHRLLVRGKRISAIAAISTDGLVDVELVTGTVDADLFYDFVRSKLIPNMHEFDGSTPKSVAIMDNCAIHRVDMVTQLFEDAGILLLFLPPYSPDLNPAEEAFSCVKQYLREHDDLLQLPSIDPIGIVKAAFHSITSENCHGWITHSGYS